MNPEIDFDEIRNLVREKIYTDLEVHILEKKAEEDYSFIRLLQEKLSDRSSLNQLMFDQHITLEEPIVEGDFVQYNYSVKMDKGYQTDFIRYWKAALKFHLQQRMNGVE